MSAPTGLELDLTADELVAVIDRLVGERPPVPRLLLTVDEAQQALGGISAETFDRYVRPYVGIKYLGRRRLVVASDLERFAKTEAITT